MRYQFSERNIHEYTDDGLTVLRQIVPSSLLSDLRAQAEKARRIARTQDGPQTQRLQPVWNYPELDHRIFRDFLELAGLRAAVDALLTPEHRAEVMGVLLEPEQHAYATNWHRDFFPLPSGVDPEEFWKLGQQIKLLNQFNAALYDDSSLWVVPGSHNRRDLPEELEALGPYPIAWPALTDEMTEEEREAVCTQYTQKMPGAVQVPLLAGDVAFYRPTGWHIGRYVPYVKRATLHDAFRSPDDKAWSEKIRSMAGLAAAPKM